MNKILDKTCLNPNIILGDEMIKCREEMHNVNAYIPGKPIETVKREFNIDKVIKMASNENPFGTSEKVKEALTNYIENGLALYPDGSAYYLKEKLSKKFGVEQKNILISNGGDDALALIALSYLSNEDEVILSEYSFVRYNDNSNIQGSKIVEIPMVDFKIDLEGILKAINEKTKLIWICNPNNPTGTLLEEEEIISFFERVPKDVLIVYDEAYGEFIKNEKAPKNAFEFFKTYPNVITVKTFSKIYGLAGLRIGYLLADEEIIEIINRGRLPFNVNVLGLLAAEVALDDEEFVNFVFEENLKGREFFYNLFEELNIPYVISETNFVFFETPMIDSRDLFLELQKRGVIIRPQRNNYSRISIGTMEENKIFEKEFKEVLNNL